MKRLLPLLLLLCIFSAGAQNYVAISSENCIATTGGDVTLSFVNPPPASSIVTITFYYRGDLNGTTSNPEKFDFFDEGSNLLGTSNFQTTQCDSVQDSIVVTVPAATYNSWLADGVVDFLADADPTVANSSLSPCNQFGGSCAQAKIEYASTTGGCTNAFSNFVLDSLTGTGVKVDWVPGTGNTSFFLEYGPTGFTPGSAAGTKITGTYPGSQPPVIITGLSALTSYDLYFGEICNSGSDSVFFPAPLVFTTPTLCPLPSSVAVSGVTSLTADVSVNSPFSSFDVEWGPVGFSQGTGCFATLTTTGGVLTISNAATPSCVTQIQPNTTYQFYIRSNCSGVGNGTSSWDGPYLFTTACAAFTAPYYSGFENDALSAPPSCWEGYATGTSAFAEVHNYTATAAPAAGAQALYLYSGSSAGTDTLVAISPQFSDLTAGDKRIRFLANSDGAASQLIVGSISSPDPSGTFTPMDTIVFQTPDVYEEVVVNFTTANGYNGTDQYIVLAHSLGATFQYVRIDEFNYEEIPACPGPLSTSLGIVGVASSSANIYWGNTGQGNYTRIEWGVQGFIPGTGSSVVVPGTDTSYTITGLTPQTPYCYYIQDTCTVGGSGIYLGPVCFTTACLPLNMPVYESLDNWPIACWDSTQGTADWSKYVGGAGDNYAVADYWSNSTGIYHLTSPPITISQDAQVRFKWSHLYSSSYDGDALLVRARLVGSSNWDTVAYLQGSTDFNDATAGNTNPGNFIEEEELLNPAVYTGNDIIIEFVGYSGFGPNVYLDDIYVENAPACPDPLNPGVFGLTSSGASLGWIGTSSAISYEVWYGPQGFYQGSQTAGGTVTTTTNDTTALSSLAPNTCYEYAVRKICGPGDTSKWVGPVTFCTLCTSQLNGTYTIGGPVGPNNFPTLDSAVSILNSCGISGPVVFNLSGGVHPEIYLIQAVGSSTTNTITFNGSAAGDSIIKSGGGTSAIELNGADHTTFNNLFIKSNTGFTVWMHDDANGISFNNCQIESDRSTTSSLNSVMVASNSSTSQSSAAMNARHLSVTNCTIAGGYYGISIYNISSTNHVKGLTVTDCEFEDIYYYGLRSYYNDSVQILNNHFEPFRNTSGYGMYIYYNDAVEIMGNEVEWVGTYSLYSYYTNDGGTGTSTIANNLFNSGGTYGVYMYSNNNLDFFHNTINGGTHGMYLGGSTAANFSNLDFRNNIFTANGTGRALWIATSPLSGFTLDYNLYFNYVGTEIAYHNGVAYTSLAAWQTAETSYNAHSVVGDPVYISAADNLRILGSAPNDVGDNSVGITVDVDGDPRPASGSTIVDIGADEYTPVAGDLAFLSGDFIKGLCLSNNDSIVLSIQNLIGSTVNFSVDPLLVSYSVTGPVNTTGTITVNSGTLAPQDTLIVYDDGIDLSVPGSYTLNAYIDPTAVNVLALNDTLATPVDIIVRAQFQANPKTVILPSANDSVEICIESSFFGGGSFFMSEVSHYAGFGTGAGTVPSYLLADDYIEITGRPGADLDGYTLEQWDGSTMLATETFGPGTVMGPNGTAIFAIGQLGTSVPSPSNFYYHANGSYTGSFSSGISNGSILKDPGGTIIDAVGYNTGYSFPASSGVTPADWSGSTGGTSGSGGIHLIGPDNNVAADWIVVNATTTQDANVLNANVSVPNPSSAPGFTWSYNGVVVDTLPCMVVGPYVAGGVYQYIANYSNSCGSFADTVTVVVPNCSAPSNIGGSTLSTSSVEVTWDTTATGATNFDVEYGPAGFTIGTGIRISTMGNSHTLTGLATNLCQDFYVRAACSAIDTSAWIGPVNVCPEEVPCDNIDVYETGKKISTQSALFIPWQNGAGGDETVSTTQSNSSPNSLRVYDSGPAGFVDVVAYFDTISTGAWSIEFDIYIPTGKAGYFNIQQNHALNGVGNLWGGEIYFKASGVGEVQYSTGTVVAGTFNYSQGQWFTITSVIDLPNDSIWFEMNGTSTGVGYDYSSANVGGPLQFNGVNFYSGVIGTDQADYYMDNFCVTPYTAPGICNAPTALAVASQGCDSAVVSWNSNSGPQSSILEYGPTGFAPGTGAGTVVPLINSPYTLQNLASGTSYDVYVADTCATDTSAVAGPVNFSTLGGTLTASFTYTLGSPTATDLTLALDASGSVGATSFSWDFGDGSTGTGVNPVHIYTANGSYNVCLVVTGACGTDTLCNTVVIAGISLADHMLARTLELYPNPTEGRINLSFVTDRAGEVEITILDLSGKRVLSFTEEDFVGSYDKVLNLEVLADGTYMIKVSAPDAQVFKRVIKH